MKKGFKMGVGILFGKAVKFKPHAVFGEGNRVQGRNCISKGQQLLTPFSNHDPNAVF